MRVFNLFLQSLCSLSTSISGYILNVFASKHCGKRITKISRFLLKYLYKSVCLFEQCMYITQFSTDFKTMHIYGLNIAQGAQKNCLKIDQTTNKLFSPHIEILKLFVLNIKKPPSHTRRVSKGRQRRP